MGEIMEERGEIVEDPLTLIDKPFESIFKFIHVLPGAFSGYSMEALRPKDRRDVVLC